MSNTVQAPTGQQAGHGNEPAANASEESVRSAVGLAETVRNDAGTVITVAWLLARAAGYIVRARRTKAAVERMQRRYEDRAASARYLSDGMAVLNVDEPTVTAYAEVAARGEAAAANIATVISAADTLTVVAEQLETETEAGHGRMRDANRTHTVPMSEPEFIKRK